EGPVICGLSRAIFKDIDRAGEALKDAPKPRIHTFIGTSPLHISMVGKTPDQVLQMAVDAVARAKSHCDDVEFSPMDAARTEPQYLLDVIEATIEAGATTINIPDTVGYAVPDQFGRIIRNICEKVPNVDQAIISVHCHDDLGMATINALEALRNGARQVECTVNGLGERAGNTSLEEVVMAVKTRGDYFDLYTDIETREIVNTSRLNLKRLMELSRFVSEIANVYHDHRQPYVGESAFAHKAGVHVDAMLKQPATYEHCDAEAVGNQRRFLLSEQSGGGAVAAKLHHLIPGLDKRHPTVQKLLQKIKQLEHEGYVFEAAEASFEILARQILGSIRRPFKLINYRTINRKSVAGSEVEAIVKIEIDGQIYHTVGEGDGPVNALDSALRLALESVYPTLKDVRLEDYKVRVLSSADGTAAKVRVLVESSDRQRVWNTVGVSENIIEASWMALVDSLTYKLLLDDIIVVG
ncbi:(R)-citramalate synthase, partial [Geodia barretti]